VDRAARRVAAEEKKKKKDAEKARACERRRARDALEKRRRQQEREGLPREPSPETPDDDDDDDDEEEDDMAARLGLSPGLGCGQEPSSQPPSGPTPSVPGVGASGSRPEARGRLLPRGRRSYRQRMGVTLKSSRPCPGNLLPGRPKQGGAEVAGEADLGGRFGSRDPRNLPPGAVDHGSKWVSISGCLRLGFPFICLGRDFPFLFYSASEAMARPTWHPGRPLRRRRSVRPAPPRTLSFGRPFRRAFHRRGLGRRLSLGNRFPRLALLPRRPS
jgi:hypothetical protein